jgi:hypothetical protein
MKPAAASVGVADHGGWAILVTLAPDGGLLDRRRVELLEAGLPNFPHHHEGSWAVGRYLNLPEARPISLPEAVALVARVRESAMKCAHERLAALAANLPVAVGRIALRVCPAIPATTEERIADVRAQTVADSVMYRQALAGAAEARGWEVYWYERERVLADAVEVLREMGRAIGPPWNADYKLAAAAALAVAVRPASALVPAEPSTTARPTTARPTTARPTTARSTAARPVVTPAAAAHGAHTLKRTRARRGQRS